MCYFSLVEYVFSIVIIVCCSVSVLFFSTLSFRRNKPFLEPYLDLCLLVMNKSSVSYKCMIGKYQRYMAASYPYRLPTIISSCSTSAAQKSLTLHTKDV